MIKHVRFERLVHFSLGERLRTTSAVDLDACPLVRGGNSSGCISAAVSLRRVVRTTATFFCSSVSFCPLLGIQQTSLIRTAGSISMDRLLSPLSSGEGSPSVVRGTRSRSSGCPFRNLYSESALTCTAISRVAETLYNPGNTPISASSFLRL